MSEYEAINRDLQYTIDELRAARDEWRKIAEAALMALSEVQTFDAYSFKQEAFERYRRLVGDE